MTTQRTAAPQQRSRRAARGLGIGAVLASLVVAFPATAAAQSSSSGSVSSLLGSEALVTGGFSVACQYAPAGSVQLCNDLEPITREDPIALKVNPVTTHIVILGAGLFDDGSIRDILEQRLQTGLRLAQTYPTAPIVLTGGVPKNGITEARAMYNWLVGAGVDPARLILEENSNSTLQNAEFTADILADRGATAAVIVTNDFHTKRAISNFRQYVHGTIPVTGVVA